MSSKSYSSFNFLLGLKENQLKVDGYLYTLGNYTKTSKNTGNENMLNQKLKRDCGRARNAQGSPKAGARATFVQNNLAQPPFVSYNINHHPNHHFLWHVFLEVQFELICGFYKHHL